MISPIFHKGSGLGNQLARYVAVRCLALDKGYKFGVLSPENFKGASFIDLDMGLDCPSGDVFYYPDFIEEKIVNEQGVDIRPYDEKFKDIQDNTIVDGEFQDERYFVHRLPEIRQWLKTTDTRYYPMDLCVINFRGGEYVGVRDLFLTQEYWDKAIALMREIHPQMKFEVHTDDYETALEFFPDFPIISDMEKNWKAIRGASYLILSNSSFAILPAHLNEKVQVIIAPKYWARRNIKVQAMKQNKYKKFRHI